MDERSHYSTIDISAQITNNRQLLRDIMEDCGFKPYDYEWWHYVLRNEPYASKIIAFIITFPPPPLIVILFHHETLVTYVFCRSSMNNC